MRKMDPEAVMNEQVRFHENLVDLRNNNSQNENHRWTSSENG